MIREDRELLAELARLNSDMAQLALRIMAGSASGRQRQWRLLWERLRTLRREARRPPDRTRPDGALPDRDAELLQRPYHETV